jgi:DNA-binding NarL/FixJ family response regulator
VIVIEDQALLRDGLMRLFTDKGHDVVGSGGDTNGLAELVAATEPDLVMLDLRMPPTFTDEGATAARSLKTNRPELGVLLLSQHVDTTSVVDLVPSRASATSSRTGSSRSTSSSTPPDGWPAAGRPWTPRSFPRW